MIIGLEISSKCNIGMIAKLRYLVVLASCLLNSLLKGIGNENWLYITSKPI